jgi:hypothetical protein
MTVRRLLAAAVLLAGLGAVAAPSASARPAACAWVDPNGVCITNPLDDLPRVPRLPVPPLP